MNIIFYIFLISFLLSRLSTENFFIDIFNQLSFQILLGGVVLFFILLLFKKIRTSIVCILVCLFLAIDILPSCNNCNSIVEINPQNDNKIRLLTFNTSYAIDSDLPKWFLYLEKTLIKNKSAKLDETEDLKSLQDLISKEAPDIVHFQEITLRFKDKIKFLKSTYPYSFLVD